MRGIVDTEGTIRERQIHIREEQVRTWRHHRRSEKHSNQWVGVSESN